MRVIGLNKQVGVIIVAVGISVVSASLWGIQSTRLANTSQVETQVSLLDSIPCIPCNKDIFVLSTGDISRLIRKYKLNNTGIYEAQINLEKIVLNYRDGQLVSADSSLPKAMQYKSNDMNCGIGSVGLSAVYGTELTGTKDYDTLVKIEFNGRRQYNEFMNDVLDTIFGDKEISNKILEYGTGELNVGSAVVKIEDNTYGSGNSVGNLKISVYSNSGVQLEKNLDASRLMELEQLTNPSAFKELKNYNEKVMGKVLNISDFDKIEENALKDGITSVVYERAYTLEFDRALNKELDKDMEYYIEKRYKYPDKEIVLHIDDYDRFNCKRKYYIDVMSQDDKVLEEMNKILMDGNGKLDEKLDKNKNKSLIIVDKN